MKITAKQSMSGVALPRTSPAYQEEASAQTVAAPLGYWRAALHRYGVSVLLEKRAVAVNIGLSAVLLAACVLYLSLGSVTLSPSAVVASLIGQGDSMTTFMVQQLRLPRLIAACFTGAAFALAGVLMQTLARNRLATPGIIGIDNGATAFAVASIVGLGVGIAPPAMALAGATTAAVLTFGLAAGSGTQGYRFIVAGIGVGAVFGAVTQLMLARVAIDTANAAYPWTVGSLNARPASAVQLLGIGLALGLVAALALARSLTLLRFKDATASGLGTAVKARRLQVLLLSVVLTALAVAVAGPVGLVALIGPEIARSLSSARHVPILAATLAGALVMVLADLAGRTLFAPIEIPVGIVTAVVGGPWLLWILMRPQRSRP
ncbi:MULTISPECIES: iron ABC transporter permease [unclassified Halomonas]|uniref:FecCD family ABC transporter permease n=1 Tax=unclassified Halomonas TaxID=2609666 RepID=UPI001EF7380D|nr:MULTISPECIES: iron ABC transporter permease [unclassified Halomonas]MCG7576184.1 iron ABC transporter permease [Halomonas sp. MMH1-48]MCG7603036.1 iron ABC transporter permease [Halomonas sp. MM17-34]MCG7612286.1 iron ABC transporter permease [Halomonas sp. MM17-29]MCG7619167.1 iron ABC transporter permease [Halomonas sp. DSH1-27]